MGLKIAVVGLSPSSHYLVPWFDPTWKKWGLAWDADWSRMDRCFELHDMALIDSPDAPHCYKPLDRYMERLKDCPGLVMQKQYVPNAEVYPLEAVQASVGDYFNSSIAFMFALAIHEKAEVIGLWGVDMNGHDEYQYQRPNMEYLIGLASGKGITVLLPDVSPLCQFQPIPGQKPESHTRYGWIDGSR